MITHRLLSLSAVVAAVVLSVSGASAAPRHPGHGHPGHGRGGHVRPGHAHPGHGGPHRRGPFGRPHGGGFRFGHPRFGEGHRFGPRVGRVVVVRGGRTIIVPRPVPVFAGPRFVRPLPVYGRGVPFGVASGCTTARHVGVTPAYRKVVTVRTCILPR